MILVQVQQSWLQVLTGAMTPDAAVLGDWPGVDERHVGQYGDVLAGVYGNTIVAVYDIDPAQTAYVQGKVRFGGKPSTAWAHLVGQHNPGEPWGRDGFSGSVQFVDTGVVAGGAVQVEETAGGRRAVVDGFVLSVDANGNAAVLVPAGRTLTMHAAQPAVPVR